MERIGMRTHGKKECVVCGAMVLENDLAWTSHVRKHVSDGLMYESRSGMAGVPGYSPTVFSMTDEGMVFREDRIETDDGGDPSRIQEDFVIQDLVKSRRDAGLAAGRTRLSVLADLRKVCNRAVLARVFNKEYPLAPSELMDRMAYDHMSQGLAKRLQAAGLTCQQVVTVLAVIRCPEEARAETKVECT